MKEMTPESLQIEMVPIAGGSFRMGGTADLYEKHWHDRDFSWSDNLTPIRDVTVSDFEISRYPITVGQYRKAVECGVCNPPQEGWSEAPGEAEDRPIRGIHIRDAEQFAAFLGCRLLSEVEWEYAIAGPHLRPYAWGWSRPDFSTLIEAEIDSDSDGQALLQQYGKEQLLQTNLTRDAEETTGPEENDCTPEGVGHFYLSSELVADSWSCYYCNGYDLERYGIPFDEKPYRASDETERVLRYNAFSRRPIGLDEGIGFVFRIARICALGSEERKALQEKRDRAEEVERIRFQAQRERLREIYSNYLKSRDGERSLEDCEAFAREIGLEFVALPAGRFYGGHLFKPYTTEAEGDYFVKAMPTFEISKYPVTVEQMREAVRRGYCPHPSTDVKETNYTEDPGESERDPVKCSLQVARAFAKAVGGRLPCESEWLYAARGVEGRLFPWGDDLPTHAHAHYRDIENLDDPWVTRVDAHPLGATPEGVFDMAGNASELTELDQRTDFLLGRQVYRLHGGYWYGREVGELANDAYSEASWPGGIRVIRAAKNPKVDPREPVKPADIQPILDQDRRRRMEAERERKAKK